MPHDFEPASGSQFAVSGTQFNSWKKMVPDPGTTPHTVVLGAALARNMCIYERRFFLNISVSVCQIVAPFRKYQDNHILLCANAKLS